MLDTERSTTLAIWANSDKPKEFFDFASPEESEFFDKVRTGKPSGGVSVYPAELPGMQPVMKKPTKS